MATSLTILRDYRELRIKYLSSGAVKFDFVVYSKRYNAAGEPEINARMEVIERKITRLWEIIDLLTHPDILHPVHKDGRVQLFGENNTHWVHVRWEGWNIQEINHRLTV